VKARASEVFVGRVHELCELEQALETARAGSGTTALVAGEAGIGKTRLASELARRAGEAGFQVLLGRAIDLVGTELPYQPFVEALRPLVEPRQLDRPAGSQRRMFEDILALLTDRAASAPVLLVLEDLHWADTSTLDLVVFLAYNVDNRPLLLLVTYRGDEPSSAERVRRLADGVGRSGAAIALELGPLEDEELVTLLAAHVDAPRPAPRLDAIVARAEGNPFFAEELVAAAAHESGEVPLRLRDLLLQRVSRLDRRTQSLLQLAAAAGRDVGYSLLHATATLPESDTRESLRRAVEYGVLVANQANASFRFRHALLAEAVYGTILPGEREELHARLAEALARDGAPPTELATHWAAAGRSAEALSASVEAARQAEAVFGLAEARAHLERALDLWASVPDAAELARVDLAELCSWAAELASRTGAAPRALELARRTVELIGESNPLRAATAHEHLARYLFENGDYDAGLAADRRAVDLAPSHPPSPERANVLAALAAGLMLVWRHDESLAVCEQALAVARAVGAGIPELRALGVLGIDLAYLGRGDEGVAELRLALELAERSGDPVALDRTYAHLTDVLTMLGRPRESARLAEAALEELRRYGIDETTLVSNWIEALIASGDWDEAERVSTAALRAMTGNYPHHLLFVRADLEAGRGDFGEARAHFEAARSNLESLDFAMAWYDAFVAELDLWERRWTDAEERVRDGLARARSRETAQIRIRLCAVGLRAQAELAAFARARRDTDAVRDRLDRSRKLRAAARRAAASAAPVTPNTDGWRALAEAEYERARDVARPDLWAAAAAAWERLERPPRAAYCSWRQAEALVAAGASRAEVVEPLREAYGVAVRIGARPLAAELELLARRARLDLESPDVGTADGTRNVEQLLGLTPREAEILTLVARGLTNREIAAKPVISVSTASVHVSHILRKLDARNRQEAAAIMHRLSPPHVEPPGFEG
jgi:DNA-binding CsgD family transcriptional regulator/tetratricopeptide (TPR) repeat protein